ncbi:MAG: hypothetical protein QOJ84_3769 [Bradyrhizobium sp.]|jgi:hypothetical protein|nr:hypothetical protein [Bradyrhizobium sp.]
MNIIVKNATALVPSSQDHPMEIGREFGLHFEFKDDGSLLVHEFADNSRRAVKQSPAATLKVSVREFVQAAQYAFGNIEPSRDVHETDQVRLQQDLYQILRCRHIEDYSKFLNVPEKWKVKLGLTERSLRAAASHVEIQAAYFGLLAGPDKPATAGAASDASGPPRDPR